MYPYVHCSIIHGGQAMETTEVSLKKMWNTTWPRDEMLPFVTAWVDLKKMMLSEIQAFGHFTILPSPLYNLYLNSSILELHFYAA